MSDLATNVIERGYPGDVLTLAHEVVKLRAALAEMTAARDEACASEVERMRPVYEAALAWREGRDRDVIGTGPSGQRRKVTGVALIDAIDRATKDKR